MKNEDDLKKNKEHLKKILIPLKFRGKPFLGLAQLSKICIIIYLSVHSLVKSTVHGGFSDISLG